MKFCTKCCRQLAEDAVFCDGCGMRQADDAKQPRAVTCEPFAKRQTPADWGNGTPSGRDAADDRHRGRRDHGARACLARCDIMRRCCFGVPSDDRNLFYKEERKHYGNKKV